ncbi:MAG TPA: hypothetical protein VLH18_04765 [Candidatus Limnocylindrales bacterium]|nr:hypothetical protein [Candidatus Limnocylindrales bacterium]
MQLIFELSQIFLSTFVLALFMPFFWFVLFIVYLQYRRLAFTEEKLYGRTINRVGRQMLFSIGLGIVGGFLASLALILLGLSLEQMGLYFVWPVAILLMLINPRYLCFSYAGGIVTFVVLLMRHFIIPFFPQMAEFAFVESLLRVHIPALLILIGLLHLMESLLIYLGGHWGSSPIYLKNVDGTVVGAFSLQRFWPIPLAALTVTIVMQSEILGVDMPGWWPLIRSTLQPGFGQTLQYMIFPVAAGLGYADIAFSSTPRERSQSSARDLAIYSTVLLVIALGSAIYYWLILPGVLFAPIGHELLILYSKKREQSNLPCYQSSSSGVQLMMVLPGTAAAEAGLLEDDIILKVNNELPLDNQDLLQKIENSYFLVLLEGTRNGNPFSIVLKKRGSGSAEEKDVLKTRLHSQSPYALLHGGAALGLITAPSSGSPVYLEIRKDVTLVAPRRLLRKLRSWFS